MTGNPPRIQGVALMRDFVQLAGQWERKQPEDIRDLLQLWHDEVEGVVLTRRELSTLRAAARKLRNLCSDRAGIMSDLLPVGSFGGPLITAAGFAAAQTQRMPPWLAAIVIVIGLTALVSTGLVGTQQRRWKVPVEDLSAFEKKLAERMATPTIAPDEDSDERIIRSLREFVGGATPEPVKPDSSDTPPRGGAAIKGRIAPPEVRIAAEPGDEDEEPEPSNKKPLKIKES